MKIYDLSHEITNDINLFPGDPEVSLEKVTTVKDDGYMLHKIVINSHLATHIDAPAHIIADGKTVDEYPLDHFTGRALVLHTQPNRNGNLIPEIPANIEFEHLIINSGWHKRWGRDDYFKDYPLLSLKIAKEIAQLPLKTISFDTPSVDLPENNEFPIHHLFLEKNILILENLTALDPLNEKYVELYAFPLKLKGVDGSPVRVTATL